MTAPPPSPPTDPAILGLDNVRLELPLAHVGSRALAFIIDLALLVLLQLLWILGGATLLGWLDAGTGWVFGILGFGAFFLQWGYFAALEIAMDGQTPGKLAVGLRVISHRAGRPSAMAILIRNFIRTLDIFVGLPIMAFDRRARRLGDLVAGTLVVHHRDSAAEEARLGRHPLGWGAREVAVVESFLRQADHMDRTLAEELATRILDWIRRRDPVFWRSVEPGIVEVSERVLVLRQVLEAKV